MVEAPSLKELREHKNQKPETLCCILIAPKFNEIAYSSFIKKFGYLDTRTGSNIDFYWAGYGAYWNNSIVPDMEEVGIGKYEGGIIIPWSFSQTLFANFVDELEEETSWKYSGGTEIIFLDPNLDFSTCIVLRVDEMIEDKIIKNPNELLEAIIQYSRTNSNNIKRFSLNGLKKAAGEEIINGILSALPKHFENLLNTWKKGRHYTILDIS